MGAFDRWKQYRIGWVFESGKDVSSSHGAGKAPALELFMGFGVLLGDNTTAMTEISNFETLRPRRSPPGQYQPSSPAPTAGHCAGPVCVGYERCTAGEVMHQKGVSIE
jgi:hypothetical protein